MWLFCFYLILVMTPISSPSAQLTQDAPLTLDSFRHLSPEEGARRLIGPAARLVSKMTVGQPPPFPSRSLDAVGLYLKPIAVGRGICMQDKLEVTLKPAGGIPISASDASTPMKIANIKRIHEFAAVGNLRGPSTPDENAAVVAKCGTVQPFTFFVASSADEAWEGAFLAEMALKQAASDGPQKFRSKCNIGPACATAYGRLIKLSAVNIESVRRDCVGFTAVCYTVGLGDGPGYWTIRIEASRAGSVRADPKFKLKSTSFAAAPRAVI